MAVVTAYKAVDSVAILPELVSPHEPWSQSAAYNQAYASGPAYAVVNNLLPISELETPISAYIAESYFSDIYNKVLCLPAQVDAGSILESQSVDVEVWNSFLESKTLSSIDAISAGGISLSGGVAAPAVFAPLESQVYDAIISTQGPAVIDASFVFNFGAESASISITGLRVTVFPFVPQRSHTETLQWSTEIIPALDVEQRIVKRHIPRRVMSYTYQLDSQQYARAFAVAEAWNFRVFGVPLWAYAMRVTGINAGDTAINYATNEHFAVDESIMIFASDSQSETVVVTAKDGSSLTLQTPIVGSYPRAFIVPLRLARSLGGISFQRFKDGISTSTAEFTTVRDIAPSAQQSSIQYRGQSVLELPAVVSGSLAESVTRRVEVVDQLPNVQPDVYELDEMLSNTYQVDILARDPVQAEQVVTFFHSIKGRNQDFYVSAGNKDLIIARTIGDTASALDVQAIGYASYYSIKDIEIILKDGTIFYRRVLSGAESVNPGEEVLSIDSALGQEIEPADVERISFLNNVRLASDNVTIERNGMTSRLRIQVIAK